MENISTHSKRPREPNYGSFPDASGINQVGAVDPLVAGTYLCTYMHTYRVVFLIVRPKND